MAYIISLIGFILENTLSIYLNNTYFSILFVVSTLGFIYPFFYKNEKKYLIYAFTNGLLYDLIFTDTLMFNALIFLIIALLITKINIYLVNSAVNTVIITIIIIFTYLMLSYIGLSISGYLIFDVKKFVEIFLHNILINVLYSLIFYFILERISVKYKILKVNWDKKYH